MNESCKAVLFDWAYTLVDLVDENDREPLKKIFDFLRSKGMTLPDFEKSYESCHDIFYKMIAVSREAGLEARFEVALNYLFFQYGISLNGTATMRELLTLYYEDIYAKRRVYPEVMETLRNLKGRGLALGVISNTTNPGFMKDREQEMMGLRSFFDFSIYSSEVPFRKPHPSIYQLAVRRLGCEAREILFVGDHPVADVAGPQAVGMRAAWLNRDRSPLPEGIRPDHVIHSLDEVLPLLGPG